MTYRERRLEAALHELLHLIDDGVLVRNTRLDRESNWMIKAARLVGSLKEAREALESKD